MYTIYSKMCSSLFFNAPNMLVTLYPFLASLQKVLIKSEISDITKELC